MLIYEYKQKSLTVDKFKHATHHLTVGGFTFGFGGDNVGSLGLGFGGLGNSFMFPSECFTTKNNKNHK